MKTLTSMAIAVSVLGMTGIPVIAQTQTITEQQAINSVPTISLKINQGMNLKLPSGVLVYKGWLDDGTLAQVDGDRPFEEGASIVHLVARKSGQTQLSLMVRDSNGVDSLYVFKLVAGNSGSSIVNVTANPINPRSVSGATFVSTQTQAYRQPEVEGVEIFQRGIDLAISRGLLIQNSELHRKLEAFTDKVGQGMPVEQAAGRSGLNNRTIEQLFNLGRTAPRSFPVPREEQTLVKAEPKTETVVVAKTEPVAKVEPVSKPDTSALEQRLAKLESRVNQLDTKVSTLDNQQEEFLAKLNDLNVQQELFLAKVESLELAQKSPSPKSRPIQITLESLEDKVQPVAAKTEDIKPLLVPETGIGGTTTLNSHEVANALSLGLLTHPDTPYRNWLYMRYQSMIRKLREGQNPIAAAKASQIKLVHVKSVLEQGGVDPAEAGL